MRILPKTLVLICGAGLLGCQDAGQTNPTESLGLAADATTTAFKLGNGKDKGNDIVIGAGTSAADGMSFIVDARSDPLGDKPKGHLTIDFTTQGGTVHQGKVTCLTVVGNRAAVGMEYFGSPVDGLFLIVEDNGSLGGTVPDETSWVTGGGTPNDCPVALALAVFTFPLSSGDVVVEDALPAVP